MAWILLWLRKTSVMRAIKFPRLLIVWPVAVLFLLFGFGNANAQFYDDEPVRDVRRVEFELGSGYSFAANKCGFDKNKAGYNLLFELRYNLGKVPVDVGLHASYFEMAREVIGTQPGSTAYSNKFNSFTFLAVSNYNFWRGKTASIYAGAGIGVTTVESTEEYIYETWPLHGVEFDSPKFCFMPRVGVELFNHFRITAAYKMQGKIHSNFNLTFGFVLGGGKIRH